MVLVADGLGGSALNDLPEFQCVIEPNAWIGLGGFVKGDGSTEPGTINLNIGQRGYVGLVRLTDGTVNLAAAIDPRFVKKMGGPETAARKILEECGVKLTTDHAHHWNMKGTPILTRRRKCVAGPGLLVMGDAASYVEPFTGEGMAWALASGQAAAALAAKMINDRSEYADTAPILSWHAWHNSTIRKRQLASRLVRELVHRPAFARAALAFMAGRPWRAAPASAIAQRLSAPYPPPASVAHQRTDGGAAA
jgi:flavin-dependent dehydrogenase